MNLARPFLKREKPLPLLQQVQAYHQNQSGAQQLYQQNMAEQARQQAEYQRRLAADEVGIEPYSLFFGRQTEDPSAGFELAPADVFPGSAAVKTAGTGLLSLLPIMAGASKLKGVKKNIFYHGSPESGLNKLTPNRDSDSDFRGVSVADDPDLAMEYYKEGGDLYKVEVDGEVIEFFDLVDAMESDLKKEFSDLSESEIEKWIKENGYVGVRYPDMTGHGVRLVDTANPKIVDRGF